VLGSNGERNRLVLSETTPTPNPFQQIQAEIAPQRFLDDLAVTLAHAGSPDLHRSEDLIVDSECSSRLCH
jgi:hypothetical protein